MNTKKKAGGNTGLSNRCADILARVHAAIKVAIVTLALWQVLPPAAADWLIQRLRLGGA